MLKVPEWRTRELPLHPQDLTEASPHILVMASGVCPFMSDHRVCRRRDPFLPATRLSGPRLVNCRIRGTLQNSGSVGLLVFFANASQAKYDFSNKNKKKRKTSVMDHLDRHFFRPRTAQHFALLFSLSRQIFALFCLLVELWPRVAATDHPNCAFRLPVVILRKPGGLWDSQAPSLLPLLLPALSSSPVLLLFLLPPPPRPLLPPSLLSGAPTLWLLNPENLEPF